MERLLGYDIGGTKCSVLYGETSDCGLRIVDKIKFATGKVDEALSALVSSTKTVLERNGLVPGDVSALGISCGGPLDSRRGIIQSPPNLPGWDNIRIVELVEKEFGIPAGIQNDANACALAEWRFGAGRGTRNMVFLTFGTGLGAGLILDGRLYAGTNDNAGEVGHVRLADFGPVGYGKSGSFEGFCSGGGMAQLAGIRVKERLQMGESPALCPSYAELGDLTAKKVAEFAEKGDELALEVCRTTGRFLGKGLSMLIDILNPERIVIGSIYERSGHLLKEYMEEVIEKEALGAAKKVCEVVPAALGDSIGDIAALSVAAEVAENAGETAATEEMASMLPKKETVHHAIRNRIGN